MTTTETVVRTHRVCAGVYRTLDNTVEILHVLDFGLDEWRTFEVDADGYQGEWMQTYATKADALRGLAS